MNISRLPLLMALSISAVVPSALHASVVNLATSGVASASSSDYGTIALDGNDGSRDSLYANGSVWHSTDPGGGNGTPAYYEVTLPSAKILDHLRIFNRMDVVQGSVQNFRITAYNGATQVFSNVFLPTSNTHAGGGNVAWGTDDLRGLTADRVRIERLDVLNPNFLTFAELEIYGSNSGIDPYLAPVGTTGSAAGFGTSVASGADGNIDGNYFSPGNPIYHSAGQSVGQFWEMDLGGNKMVSELMVFNRTDSPTSTNVKISLLDASNVETWSTTQNINRGAGPSYNYGFDLPVGAIGQRVRVETLDNEFLAFGEIQAFGTVPEASQTILIGLGLLGCIRRRR